jgi:hypothetical protein
MDPRLHKLIMPRTDGRPGTQEVRRFNDLSMQSVIDDALARVEENSAIVEVNVEKQGEGRPQVEAILAAKLGGHWSIGGSLGYVDRDHWSAGGKVVFSWK